MMQFFQINGELQPSLHFQNRARTTVAQTITGKSPQPAALPKPWKKSSTEDYIMHKKISPSKCGCRRNRLTADHLVRLEIAIRTAFAHLEHMITIFFDLLKAYDTTWKYGILSDLYDGTMLYDLPLIVQQFLCNRKDGATSFRQIYSGRRSTTRMCTFCDSVCCES